MLRTAQRTRWTGSGAGTRIRPARRLCRGHADLASGKAASEKHSGAHRWQPDPRRRNAWYQPSHLTKQDSRIRFAAQEIRITWRPLQLMQLLQGYLKVASDRQQTVASNIANVDTPGYHTQDIDLQSAMQQAMNEGRQQCSPRSGHVDVDGLPERPDGNNVNIDRESMLLGETQLQYQMGVQLIKAEFHRLLTAIKEGN